MTDARRRHTNPNYGRGQHSIRFDDDVLIDEQEMSARILASFRTPDYRPPTLPAVAMELMALSQEPSVDMEAVARLLERDAVLAARVLRIAQSPAYGASPVSSLQQALVRLGLATLRDLVLQVAMNMRVFRCEAYSESMLCVSRHGAATAHCASAISRFTPLTDGYAFLCGLLHDVGVAGVLIALAEGRGKGREEPPNLDVLWPAIDASHAEASRLMCELWELPAEIILVMGAHHRPKIEGFVHPLAATVCVADQIACELGFGWVPAAKPDETDPQDEADGGVHTTEMGISIDQTSPRSFQNACEALELDERRLELAREAARERLESVDLGGA